MEYKNAPVSEVVIGLNYKKSIFTEDELFQINTVLSEKYPNVEILPPINIETLNGYQLQVGFDIPSSGQILYRRRTKNRDWLVQVQQNKIYLNWIRDDTIPVGNYPGFSSIIDTFYELLNQISILLSKDLYKDVALCDLTYHDRFSWQDYITDLSKINDILDISIPKIPNENNNNIFTKFTYPIQRINGFGIISINTATNPTNVKQILRIETSLRGKTKDVKEWFINAHAIQNSIFESIFRDDLRQQWKKQ